jgi:DNA-directed RNA polymerase specialized sigma24 family protein
MRMKKKPEHYVDNKEFLSALSIYKIKVNRALTEGTTRPMIPNYVGECFLKIATHLSYRPNFVNYPFREDMISDGIENCVQYIDNFDPDRGNPFAYFTQIIYYAFLRRIQKEKKQLEIKAKILERSGYDEVLHADVNELNFSASSYNSIKQNIEQKTRK